MMAAPQDKDHNAAILMCADSSNRKWKVENRKNGEFSELFLFWWKVEGK
jgi:hypothetical protein